MCALRDILVWALLGYAAGWDDQTTSSPLSPTTSSALTMVSNLLNSSSYDKALRPNFHGPPVHVICSIRINSFQSSSDNTMDYTVNMYFRTRWVDPRLRYYDKQNHSVAFGAEGVKKLWLPPLFFPDEKSARFHVITMENTLLRIHPDGTVLHSTRVTLTLACHMSLERYPMDDQTCSLDIESFSYAIEDLVLHWASFEDTLIALEMDDHLLLPQFEITSAYAERDICVREYTTGNFSCLLARFGLRRRREMFIMSSYLPSLLIVVLSWFSFWINPNSEPARVSLCMTALLTISTQMNGIQGAVPNVSNLKGGMQYDAVEDDNKLILQFTKNKAIDVWMSVCLIFVFAALVEYAAVNYITLKERKRSGQDKKKEVVNPPTEMQPITETNHKNSETNASKSLTPTDVRIDFDLSEEHTNNRLVPKLHFLLVGHSKLSVPESIDYFSRILFPITFLIFNMIYWPTYIHWLE